MSTITPSAPHPSLEDRGTRASSVILHRVPPERVDEFLEWERGITRAAEQSPGYQATDVYPPADRRRQEWVIVVHFKDAESLQRWTDSPQRIEWTGKLPAGIGDFRMKTLPAGFGSWFAGMVDGGPAGWQMALTVVLGLYPTVMLLSLGVGPYLKPLGLAASMLISNALSVSILQWGVMPLLEKALRPWLHVEARNRGATLAGGLVLVVVLLAGMVFLFRQATG